MYSYVDGDGNIFMADSSGAFRTTMGFFNRKIERYNIFSDTVTTENQICYVNRSKQGLAAGWQTINGNTYYFRQGVALTGVQYINSDKFVFDSNGKLISKR